MILKIKEEFKDQIQDIFFEKEDGLNFLRVQVNETRLDDVAILAKKISEFLDKVDYSDQEYYLDVYSSGAEKTIDKFEIQKYIVKNVFVQLEEPVKGFDNFDGEIIEADKKQIVIRWNAKGQFRKVNIEINNIKDIKISLKLSKRK